MRNISNIFGNGSPEPNLRYVRLHDGTLALWLCTPHTSLDLGTWLLYSKSFMSEPMYTSRNDCTATCHYSVGITRVTLFTRLSSWHSGGVFSLSFFIHYCHTDTQIRLGRVFPFIANTLFLRPQAQTLLVQPSAQCFESTSFLHGLTFMKVWV
jgi:hypothetical protein